MNLHLSPSDWVAIFAKLHKLFKAVFDTFYSPMWNVEKDNKRVRSKLFTGFLFCFVLRFLHALNLGFTGLRCGGEQSKWVAGQSLGRRLSLTFDPEIEVDCPSCIYNFPGSKFPRFHLCSLQGVCGMLSVLCSSIMAIFTSTFASHLFPVHYLLAAFYGMILDIILLPFLSVKSIIHGYGTLSFLHKRRENSV